MSWRTRWKITFCMLPFNGSTFREPVTAFCVAGIFLWSGWLVCQTCEINQACRPLLYSNLLFCIWGSNPHFWNARPPKYCKRCKFICLGIICGKKRQSHYPRLSRQSLWKGLNLGREVSVDIYWLSNWTWPSPFPAQRTNPAVKEELKAVKFHTYRWGHSLGETCSNA